MSDIPPDDFDVEFDLRTDPPNIIYRIKRLYESDSDESDTDDDSVVFIPAPVVVALEPDVVFIPAPVVVALEPQADVVFVPAPEVIAAPPVPAAIAEHMCSVCHNFTERIFMLVPCGHACLCADCALVLNQRQSTSCPICRLEFEGVFPVYFSS